MEKQKDRGERVDNMQERRKDDQRVRQLVSDVGQLKLDVAANTQLTQQIRESTAGLVEFFNDSRDAFRLFNKTMGMVRWFLRKAMFPLVFIAAAGYAVTHGGRLPEWIKVWFDLFK